MNNKEKNKEFVSYEIETNTVAPSKEETKRKKGKKEKKEFTRGR